VPVLEFTLDNPFKESSRNHQLFDVLANADRPLRPEELAAAVGESDPGIAHSMLKYLRGRDIIVYRYRDPQGASPGASVYSLRPVEGFVELTREPRSRGPRRAVSPPVPVRPGVRQPQVGSVARVTALLLEGEALRARFECDGVVYVGSVANAQPAVGEWLTLTTVGLHGRGLYVDLAGARVVTIENLGEVVSDAG
jgi:hypothetical protein